MIMANYRGNMHLYEFSYLELKEIWKECHGLAQKDYPALWSFLREIGEVVD